MRPSYLQIWYVYLYYKLIIESQNKYYYEKINRIQHNSIYSTCV